MAWPDVPFTLNKDPKSDGDCLLVRYLQDETKIKYLSQSSREHIARLEFDDDKNDLRYFHEELLKLWPIVITDTLLELKRHDREEYDKGIDPVKMDSFFDPASLGTAELQDVLKAFSEFEGMMYGASPSHYRDHIEHSFRVWIIGHGILNACFGKQLQCPSVIEPVTPEEWECMWAMVALCHDIGYPLSHIERINERARETLKRQGLTPEGDLRFAFRPQMQPFHDTIIRLMSSDPVPLEGKNDQFVTHIKNKYYLKLLKSFDNLDHGIVSSLLVGRSLVYFLESDFLQDTRKVLNARDAKQFFIRREILQAIAAHTCQDIYHIVFDTLSFLLYIVDEIQCWGRPTLEELQHEAVDIGAAFAGVKALDKGKINIEIQTKDEHWDEKQQKGVLRQIFKLRRMLRLAKDTPNLAKKQNLRFEVSNNSGQAMCLQLVNQAIELGHNGFIDTVFEDVPMLKTQIRKSSGLSPFPP